MSQQKKQKRKERAKQKAKRNRMMRNGTISRYDKREWNRPPF